MPDKEQTQEEYIKDLEKRVQKAETDLQENKRQYDRAIFHIQVLNDLVFTQKSLIAEYQEKLKITPQKEFNL